MVKVRKGDEMYNKKTSASTRLFVIAVAILLGFFPVPVFGQAPLTKVVVQMDYIPNCTHAAYAFGALLGYYAQEGLELEMLPGQGSQLVPVVVGTNRASLGFIDASVLLTARERGVPVKAVGAIYHASPGAIFFTKKSGIKSPRDLEGKTISVEFKAYFNLHLTAFLHNIGLSREKVKIVDIGTAPATATILLLSEKVDAFVRATHLAQYKEELLVNSPNFGYFVFRDYGVNSMAKVTIASEQTIREKPELIRRFNRASQRSWEQTIANPAKAIEALHKYFPAGIVVDGGSLAALKANLPFVRGKASNDKDLAYMDPSEWQETYRLLANTGLLTPGKINVEDAYTNQFVGR